VGHASRSSGSLRLKASRSRVSQSGLKTGGGTTTSGAHGIIAEVVSSGSRRRMGRCDGLHQTLLSQLCCFFVLGHKGSLVISFSINGTPSAGGEASIQPSLSHPIAIVAF
jgi:hypothetical protein